MSDFEDLNKTLILEPIEVNLFRGHSPPEAKGRIFGGQVVGQALFAAFRTVEGLICHSMHCYFIRPGDPSAPVLYQVERARDGKSFATRRVAAIQHGEQIFNLACSFQKPEEGFEHQFAMPDAPDPESLGEETAALLAKLPEQAQAYARRRPFEMRPVGLFEPHDTGVEKAGFSVWVRTKADLGDDITFNQALLAHVSDAGILEASMRPHDVRFWTPGMQVASLDHAIWFHRPAHMRDWHLYVQDSPSASGGRGFTRGAFYTQGGVLVASVAQEGLIRQRSV